MVSKSYNCFLRQLEGYITNTSSVFFFQFTCQSKNLSLHFLVQKVAFTWRESIFIWVSDCISYVVTIYQTKQSPIIKLNLMNIIEIAEKWNTVQWVLWILISQETRYHLSIQSRDEKSLQNSTGKTSSLENWHTK